MRGLGSCWPTQRTISQRRVSRILRFSHRYCSTARKSCFAFPPAEFPVNIRKNFVIIIFARSPLLFHCLVFRLVGGGFPRRMSEWKRKCPFITRILWQVSSRNENDRYAEEENRNRISESIFHKFHNRRTYNICIHLRTKRPLIYIFPSVSSYVKIAKSEDGMSAYRLSQESTWPGCDEIPQIC